MQIEIVKAGEKFPDSQPCYVVGKNGIFLRKVTRLFESVSKVERVPEFEEVRETAVWTAMKIPYRLIQEALEFFRAVEAAHQAEAIALFSFENNQWKLHVPDQSVSACRLEYKLGLDSAVSSPIGTIHSHCGMSAFFSDKDLGDVVHFDGVHIVLGKISQPVPEIAASVAANGRTIELHPGTVIEGIPNGPPVVKETHPWLSKVKRMDGQTESGAEPPSWWHPDDDPDAPEADWEDLILKASPKEREEMFEALVELMTEEGEISPEEKEMLLSEPVQGGLPWNES